MHERNKIIIAGLLGYAVGKGVRIELKIPKTLKPIEIVEEDPELEAILDEEAEILENSVYKD